MRGQIILSTYIVHIHDAYALIWIKNKKFFSMLSRTVNEDANQEDEDDINTW